MLSAEYHIYFVMTLLLKPNVGNGPGSYPSRRKLILSPIL